MGLNKTKAPPKEKVVITATVVKDFLDLLSKIGGIKNFPESIKVWKAYRFKHEIEDCISPEKIATLFRHNDNGDVFRIKTDRKVGYFNGESLSLTIDFNYKHYRFRVAVAKIVFCLYHGRWAKKGYDVDHINNKPWDNRPCNLREGTKSDNVSNRRQLKKPKSGIKGVIILEKYVKASVSKNKKKYTKYFPYSKYSSKEEAILVAKAWRDATARELHGEFFNEN
jgi:hypothetical protein